MAEINWGQIAITAGASLLGGGAMGALLNNYFTKVRSRVQPVHYRIGMDTRTGLIGPNNEYRLSVSVRHGDKVYEYPHMAIVIIRLANVGVNDIAKFPFGLALGLGDRVIMCEVESSDRHNPITIADQPTPVNPLSTIDFVCEPFNRAKEYGVTLYILPAAETGECGDITPTSPVSVKFIRTRAFPILSNNELDLILNAMSGSIPLGIGKPLLSLAKLIRRNRS